jgi:probable phosphoglycerate mutase
MLEMFNLIGKNMQEILIDLIRHGEPRGGPRYRGDGVDDPLSGKGWEQMWNGVSSRGGWEQIISSPMVRCLAFSEALGRQRGIDVTVEKNFREVGFGSWEGLSKAQVQECDLKGFEDFYRDPISHRPQGAEPIHDFIARVSHSFDKLISQYEGKHCLVVSHAGVMRAIISYVLGAGPETLYRIAVKNAGVTRIRYSGGRGILEVLNH